MPQQSEVSIAQLSSITSLAASLGAPSPAQAVLEQGLARRAQAVQTHGKLGGLTPVTVPDEIAMRGSLGFLGKLPISSELRGLIANNWL